MAMFLAKEVKHNSTGLVYSPVQFTKTEHAAGMTAPQIPPKGTARAHFACRSLPGSALSAFPILFAQKTKLVLFSKQRFSLYGGLTRDQLS
jgi:hypothetical protein